ncbi:hypothetical protein VNO77_27604 [Canavalia gladiata]|uniref:Uncharacterized protein n=1 Tax=Canavalia gladiata TaxID=3824 RepID=A0AAN9KUF4_CANGL
MHGDVGSCLTCELHGMLKTRRDHSKRSLLRGFAPYSDVLGMYRDPRTFCLLVEYSSLKSLIERERLLLSKASFSTQG